MSIYWILNQIIELREKISIQTKETIFLLNRLCTQINHCRSIIESFNIYFTSLVTSLIFQTLFTRVERIYDGPHYSINIYTISSIFFLHFSSIEHWFWQWWVSRRTVNETSRNFTIFWEGSCGSAETLVGTFNKEKVLVGAFFKNCVTIIWH